MPSFGKKSRVHLNTCHSDIIKVLEIAIKNGPDFAVICGHREESAQQKAVEDGFSEVDFPYSLHNSYPSMAVDIIPYPIDWNDVARFRELIAYIRGVADTLGIALNSGADWDGDWDHEEHRFIDWPHLELAEQNIKIEDV